MNIWFSLFTVMEGRKQVWSKDLNVFHIFVYHMEIRVFDITSVCIYVYIHTYMHTLAKEAATNVDIAICYNKIPKSVVKRKLGITSVEMWQSVWNCTTRATPPRNEYGNVRLQIKLLFAFRTANESNSYAKHLIDHLHHFGQMQDTMTILHLQNIRNRTT
jgi:hypothetical protein